MIVGLGLIGGSFAKALRDFPDIKVWGVDTNKETLEKAQKDGVIYKGDTDAGEVLDKMDVVILCINPSSCVNFINSGRFKQGAVVTDVCGVKGYIYDNIKNESIDFIGGHPMAGRECGGYESSLEDLYKGTNYILVTNSDNKKENILFLEKIIYHIGCAKITYTTPDEHDRMIGYTSQLMHVVAAALCDNEILDRAERFSAGSLRDCTRVAKLNPDMWTELFLENKDALSEQIDVFTKSLNEIGNMIKKADEDGIRSFLKRSSERKIRYLKEKARKRG